MKKKGKQHAGMCKQTYKPQEARKNLSSIHSRGESYAEILWMKEYMDGLERDHGRGTMVFWSLEKQPEKKDCCSA